MASSEREAYQEIFSEHKAALLDFNEGKSTHGEYIQIYNKQRLAVVESADLISLEYITAPRLMSEVMARWEIIIKSKEFRDG